MYSITIIIVYSVYEWFDYEFQSFSDFSTNDEINHKMRKLTKKHCIQLTPMPLTASICHHLHGEL